MLEILNRIKICIERDSLMIARDLVKLEIDSLNGITENCESSKYYYYDLNCEYCNNLNSRKDKH